MLAADRSAGIRRTAVAIAWDEESRSEREYAGVDSDRAGTRDRSACRSGGVERTSASAGVDDVGGGANRNAKPSLAEDRGMHAFGERGLFFRDMRAFGDRGFS